VVEVAHHLPIAFDVESASLPDSLTYDVASRTLTWRGTVCSAAPVNLAWKATWLGGESREGPTVTLSLPAWNLSFVREAPFYGGGLDLVGSRWQPDTDVSVRTTEPLTLTYTVSNVSANGPAQVSVSFWLMAGLGPITATKPLTQGIALPGWRGRLDPFASQDISVPVKGGAWDRPVRIDALLTTETGGRWEDALWLTFEPWCSYLPLIWRAD
jgi:hypothetical protein